MVIFGTVRLNLCSPPFLFLRQPHSYEAVEPLDLEEFLMSQLRSGDAALMQELGDFPDDDLNVEQVEKECRTVRHSVPEDGWVPRMKRQIPQIISCRTSFLCLFVLSLLDNDVQIKIDRECSFQFAKVCMRLHA